MITDHYETLGLTPHTEHSAIRPTYLALMRRYHPDRNHSPEAADRARAIATAYRVLGNPDRRMDYDMARAQARAEIDFQNSRRGGGKRTAAALLAIGGFVFMLLYLDLLAPESSDEAMDRQAAARHPQPAVQKQVDLDMPCASPRNAELIKQELFARAAGLRGSDRGVYRRLAANSVIRLQGPRSVRRTADQRLVYCNAAIGLDLPPGVALPDGRRSVASDISYSVKSAGSQGAPDGPELFHAGTAARDLASLVSVRATAELSISRDREHELQSVPPPVQVLPPPAPIIPALRPSARAGQAPRAEELTRAPPAPRVTAPLRAPPAPRVATPPQSQKARPAVTSLDRDLGALFRQSVQHADAAKRKTLFRDHYRFIARLDRCSSEPCARDEYLSRMREISTTMAARAPPP